MATKTLTSEQMLTWLEGYKAVEKLVNKNTFAAILKQSDKNWKDYWCSAANEPCLGVNEGYYKGYDAIDAYFTAKANVTEQKTAIVREAYPELMRKTVEELHGIGSLTVQNMTCQVIETALDNKTAKGIWYYTTTDIDHTAHGPEARWHWGRIGMDFINENGQWKIWHMVIAEDFEGLMGTDWNVPEPEKAPLPGLEGIADLDKQVPGPNVPQQIHEKFHRYRPVNTFPMVPKPYNTFAETFSYGI